MNKKHWHELSANQRRGVIFAAMLQYALLAAALLDIRRRSADELNGSKRWWTAALFINFVGPVAYFVVGRKRTLSQPTGSR